MQAENGPAAPHELEQEIVRVAMIARRLQDAMAGAMAAGASLGAALTKAKRATGLLIEVLKELNGDLAGL